VRVAVTRNGGTIADPGSVAYMFNRKGVLIVKKQQIGREISEDDLLEVVLDAGAEEVNDLGENFEVVTSPTELTSARDGLKRAGLEYDSADISFLPTVSVSVDVETAKLVFELIDAIEDLEDVQNVYGNFDVSDEVMASLA
jgi:transcriptional/translational regulatory protein YebC/TACO1